MALQNRVNPHGDIISTPYYGTLMGNRGILHNEKKIIIKPYDSISWITCQICYKDNRRNIMSPGKYTELFFLDEATSFSAGHRPCAMCRNADFKRFKKLWIIANKSHYNLMDESILTIDKIIHEERVDEYSNKKCYHDNLCDLPNGTFISLPSNNSVYYLYYMKSLLEWNPGGYNNIIKNNIDCQVIVWTPSSIVRMFKIGYVPSIHPSVLDLLNNEY